MNPPSNPGHPELATLTATLQFTEGSIQAAVFGRRELDHLGHLEDEDRRRTMERRFLAEQFSLPETSIYTLRQTHSDQSFHIDGALPARELYFDSGDALFTDQRDLLLVIRTADCLPLFFFGNQMEGERKRQVAGIIHAGWRGVHADIIPGTLERAATDLFKDDQSPVRWTFMVGPGIGGASYEVGEDVARYFQKVTAIGAGKYLLDLPSEAMLQLDRFGERMESYFQRILDDFRACTFADNDLFYSHRKGDRGRNLNVIRIRSDRDSTTDTKQNTTESGSIRIP